MFIITYIQNILISIFSPNAPTYLKTKKEESIFSRFDWLVVVACGARLKKIVRLNQDSPRKTAGTNCGIRHGYLGLRTGGRKHYKNLSILNFKARLWNVSGMCEHSYACLLGHTSVRDHQVVCISPLVLSSSLDPTDCSPPGSSVHGILQARILEWVSIPVSRRSSQPRDQTCVAGRFFHLSPRRSPTARL